MTWLLIDGNNWYARDFYASNGQVADLRTELNRTKSTIDSDANVGLNGLVGRFLRRLADLRSQIEHSRVAICWDARSSFRCELSEGYKAKRAAKPDGFYGNMMDLRNELATVAGVASFEVEGFEADDLLSALVRNALDEGEKAIVFSSDRDLHQCLAAGQVTQVTQVSRLKPGSLSFSVVTADKLELEYSVKPWQWIDYRIMVGDQSDSISGCPGIGPKSAAEVLRACKTLEAFFTQPFLPKLTPKQRSTLLAFRDQVSLRRRLITLVESAPLPATWLQGVCL